MAEFEKGLVYYNFGSRWLREKIPYLKGTDVKVLQRMLNQLPEEFRGNELKEDGIYGPRVREAVKKFQGAVGLRVDGKVGAQTFCAFGRETGLYTEEERQFGSRELKIGIQGSDVRIVQNRLNALGRKYARIIGGPADGVFGRRTRRVVRRFQLDVLKRNRAIPRDGQVKYDTFDALYTCTPMGGRTLKSGDKGYDVYWLKHFLQRCRYSEASPDGVFGPETEGAVRQFQQAWGIEADGIVGARTFFAMGMVRV